MVGLRAVCKDHSIAVTALVDSHRTEIQTIIEAYNAKISTVEKDKQSEIDRLQRALDLVKGHNKHLMSIVLAHSDCPKGHVSRLLTTIANLRNVLTVSRRT